MSNKNAGRDADICRLYETGNSVARLVEVFDLSHSRIRQILKAGNVTQRDDRPAGEGLYDFLAINVTDDEKEELRKLAEEMETTMAALSREWIRERLAEIRARKEQTAP